MQNGEQICPLFDLKQALRLMEDQKELIVKYPSLEDSIKLLKKVIMMEEPTDYDSGRIKNYE